MEKRLEDLDGITDVDVVKSTIGGDTIYRITFKDPGNTDVPELTPDGSLLGGTDEQQVVSVFNASGGDFTLTLGAETTGTIAHNAPATIAEDATNSLEAKLENLIGINDVDVSKLGTQLHDYLPRNSGR